MRIDRKTLGVMGSDEEGQTDAGVKESDRLTGLGMDRQMLGSWAWRESLRVAGSARCSVPALKYLAQVRSLHGGTSELDRLKPEAGLSREVSY